MPQNTMFFLYLSDKEIMQWPANIQRNSYASGFLCIAYLLQSYIPHYRTKTNLILCISRQI